MLLTNPTENRYVEIGRSSIPDDFPNGGANVGEGWFEQVFSMAAGSLPTGDGRGRSPLTAGDILAGFIKPGWALGDPGTVRQSGQGGVAEISKPSHIGDSSVGRAAQSIGILERCPAVVSTGRIDRLKQIHASRSRHDSHRNQEERGDNEG